jgi:electron transfer flavoprotein alpha subunit
MDVASFKGIYVFIEHDNQTAAKVSLELLGKAQGLANEFSKQGKNQLVTAILIGYELGNIADELIYYGADHVIIVKDEPFRMYRTDIYTKAIVQIAREKKPEILLFGAYGPRNMHRRGYFVTDPASLWRQYHGHHCLP